MAAFTGLFRRDLRLALRQGGDTGLVLGFFVLAVVLFPLGVGPEPAVLQRIGAGVVWVAALLAALLSLDRLFQSDYQDGGLEPAARARGTRQMRRALGGDRAAAGADEPIPGVPRRSRAWRDPDPDARTSGRHPGSQPDRQRRRRIDPRRTAPRCTVVAARPAALRAAAGVWRRCRRGECYRNRCTRPAADPRRPDPGSTAAVPLGECRGVAPSARMSHAIF